MFFFYVLPQYLHPYTLAAVCILSVLLSLHFLQYWQGEYTKQSKASKAGDHFLYSHDPNGWFNNHTVRRNKTLVTPTWWKGYVGSLSFFLTFHNTFKSYFVSLYFLFFNSVQKSQHDGIFCLVQRIAVRQTIATESLELKPLVCQSGWQASPPFWWPCIKSFSIDLWTQSS